MGLNAVVYRSFANLDLGEDRRAAKVDIETGEVYFQDEDIARRYPAELLRAAEFRLGNVSAVAALHEETENLLRGESLICGLVLYSGSHSGDAIPTSALASLAAEVKSVRESGGASQELLLFLDKLEKLIDNATIEKNPIVFV